MWKVIMLTHVICNHELQSFHDCISSCALCYVEHILSWHILHVLHINKYIALWRVNFQTWRCQLRVWTSSVVIKYFAWYLISIGLTPAYDTYLRMHMLQEMIITSQHVIYVYTVYLHCTKWMMKYNSAKVALVVINYAWKLDHVPLVIKSFVLIKGF